MINHRMIPVCEPCLSENAFKYVEDCLISNEISSAGKYVSRFEEAFASFCGVRFGISCSSGTAALHLCLAALDIGPGDEVILPSFTMIATCNAVIYTGATPVLVDSEPVTWNINPEVIADAITPRTRAIIVVHTYGHPVDIDPIASIADKKGIHLIEDAAEAHGAEYKGRPCGSLGLMAAFSFYANKIITTGEGGAVTTSDAHVAERARALRNHCFTERRFLHNGIGFNYRMTNLQAAVGLSQIEDAEKLLTARRGNAKLYNELLSDIPGIVTPPEASWAKNAYWMYGILLEDSFPCDRDMTMTALRNKGVDSRPFFLPMHQQPAYDAPIPNKPRRHRNLGVSEDLSRRGLYLPSGSGLTREEIQTVAEAVRGISVP